MAAISIAEKTFDIKSCQSLFELLYHKGYIKECDLENIYLDSDFKNIKKIKQPLPYDKNKCHAREWSIETINNVEYVLDNIQCQKIKVEGSCFCKFHNKKNETMPNGWWLGKVNERRPEPLYHPGLKNPETGEYENKIQHKWKVDCPKPQNIEKSDETPIKKKDNEEKPKKRRGRPPGSKNKKKKDSKKDSKKKKITPIKEKDQEEELEEKQTFSFDYQEEEDSIKYEVDGFAYSVNSEGDVINPHTYEYMGCSNKNGGINFIDEDAIEKHKINIASI